MTDLERAAELERIRQRTKEIQLRLERDRQEAFRKQERERTLEIGVEKQHAARADAARSAARPKP